MIDRLRSIVCALRGHDALPQFRRDRLFLKCTTCGHESAGWNLADDPVVAAPVVFTAERRKAILSRLAGV